MLVGVQLCGWPKEKHIPVQMNQSFFDNLDLLLTIAGFYVLSLLPILDNLEISKVTVQVKIFNLWWKWTCKYEEDDLSSKFQCSMIDISSLEIVYTSILILHWLRSLLGLDRITSYCCWEKAVIFWWTIKFCCFYQTVFQKSWISKPYWLHFRWEVIREMNLLSCTLIE